MTATGYRVRAELEDLIVRELLGPWDGPEEELPTGTAPGERYLLGKLVPRRSEEEEPVTDDTPTDDDDVEDRPELTDESGIDFDPDDTEGAPSAAAVRTRSMAASSLGLVFAVPTDVDRVTVTATWGRYERTHSQSRETPTGRPRTVWRRVPVEGSVEVPLDAEVSDQAVPHPDQDGVCRSLAGPAPRCATSRRGVPRQRPAGTVRSPRSGAAVPGGHLGHRAGRCRRRVRRAQRPGPAGAEATRRMTNCACLRCSTARSGSTRRGGSARWMPTWDRVTPARGD